MLKYYKYLSYLLRHKYYVAQACFKHGLYYRGLVHDLSKFLPSEFFPYMNFFFDAKGNSKTKRDSTGYYKPYDTGDIDFDTAWFHHQKRNKHHWQYWTVPHDGGTGVKPIEMPRVYANEMVCDWIGAGKAQGFTDTKAWYERNKTKLVLHPNTRRFIEAKYL